MDSSIDAAAANPRRLSLLPNFCASDSSPGGFGCAAAPLLNDLRDCSYDASQQFGLDVPEQLCQQKQVAHCSNGFRLFRLLLGNKQPAFSENVNSARSLSRKRQRALKETLLVDCPDKAAIYADGHGSVRRRLCRPILLQPHFSRVLFVQSH